MVKKYLCAMIALVLLVYGYFRVDNALRTFTRKGLTAPALLTANMNIYYYDKEKDEICSSFETVNYTEKDMIESWKRKNSIREADAYSFEAKMIRDCSWLCRLKQNQCDDLEYDVMVYVPKSIQEIDGYDNLLQSLNKTIVEYICLVEDDYKNLIKYTVVLQ